jgi:MOSC domain-containing protein YiiM
MTVGTVASLHVHPPKPGGPLLMVDSLTLVLEKGIEEDTRYFGRISKSTGRPGRRQVTLIERELVAEHAVALRLPRLPPGVVRSNIETTGIRLNALLGREVEVGTALLFFYELRIPCRQMDDICRGLRALMEEGRQGVLAEVRRSGVVRVGDAIRVLN